MNNNYVLGAILRLKEKKNEKDLKADFEKKYAQDIDKLYQRYLCEEALEKEANEHPVLNMKIEDTTLPESVKKALQSHPSWFETVKDVVKYTPEELLSGYKISQKVYDAVKQFLEENGVNYYC
jgi:hypothetical protein